MNRYEIGPARKVAVDDLLRHLAENRLPFQEQVTGKNRRIIIGPNGEYEVQITLGLTGKPKEVYILIRYEHPTIRSFLDTWMDTLHLEAPERYHSWHTTVSPSIAKAVQAQWQLDLSALPVAPIRAGKTVVVFMASQDVSPEVRRQLSHCAHKRFEPDEFVRTDEFCVSGKDPLDSHVYVVPSANGLPQYVTVGSAPASTVLCLWVSSMETAPEVNIKNLPNQAL